MRRVFRIPFSRHVSRHLRRDVDEELAFHLETRVERLVAAGWTPDAARREALRQFGDLAGVRDSCVSMDQQRERAMRRIDFIGEVRQDVVYAMRTLARNVGFALGVVGALALGIGANTAIFTLVDAVLLRHLPVPHAEQLVAIGNPLRVNGLSQGSPRTDLLSTPLYRDVRDQNDVFSGVLASGHVDRLDARIDRGNPELEHPRGRFVSGNYFAVLEVPAVAGRTFDASADGATSSPVVTISHGYWTRRFHDDPSVIGRQIVIDGVRLTIVGVTPSWFTGEIVGQVPDLWIPIGMHDAMRPNQRFDNDRNADWLLLVGRLRPGVTLAQARQEIGARVVRSIVSHSTARIASGFLQSKPTVTVASAARGLSRVRDDFHAPLVTLMIGVVLLLCIICANVANLLLARAIARGREMSVRLALGADRSRLVRQLLTESTLLALLAAGTGLLVAWVASRRLIALATDGTSMALDVGMNGAVLAFTLVVSLGAVALFGLVPALRASRVDLASAVRASAASLTGTLGGRGQRRPLGMLLIVGQVALSVVLLVGAGMLVRSLRNVQGTEVGLDRGHLVIVDVDIQAHGYVGAPLANLAHGIRDRLAALPGVAAVTFSENGIFSGNESTTTIEIPGYVPRTPADTAITYDMIGADYATAIGAHLLAGRDLATSDENKPARVALVNESFASFYFPHENAVGKFVHLNDSIAVQIVGTIADTRDHSLEGAPTRRMYFPYVHTDTSANQAGNPGSLNFEVRTSGDPTTMVQDIRRTVVAVDPSLPIDGVDPLPVLMRQSIREERLVGQLATAFGALALLLAAIGLYGVMTYTVTRRTGEIGLRAALGATRADAVRLVLTDALRLVLVGMLVGLPMALSLSRFLRAQLHGVGTVDPVSIAGAVGVLVVTAIVAATVPALRASRVPPIEALRSD